MIQSIKNLISNILITLIFVSPLTLMGGEAEIQAANELLDTILFEKVMDDSINASIQMIIKMSPKMENHEASLREYYNRHMSSATLRYDVAQLYADMFTESELKEITAFYKTKTGKKTLEKLPEIMQRSMELAQSRVMQSLDELQKILMPKKSDDNN